MNFLAGILRVFCDEESAFWLLGHMVCNIDIGFYSKKFFFYFSILNVFLLLRKVESMLPFTFNTSLSGTVTDLAVLRGTPKENEKLSIRGSLLH